MPFHKRYKNGDTPWEIHRADHNLISMVQKVPIAPCDVLDIGCGTGNNVIWLQQQGFNATGIDCTEIAIQRAREKAGKVKIDSAFYVHDFMGNNVPGAPFEFTFDRGCFHHFLQFNNLNQFAAKVALVLKNQGLWMTMTGNADESREGPGPPQLSARQIVLAVEPYFKIISLIAGHFDTDQEIPAKNWICLMKKR